MELKDLQHQLVNTLDEAERIRVQYAGKSTDMSGEEIARWTQLLDAGEGIKAQIDAVKRADSLKAWASAVNDLGGIKLAGAKAGADGEDAAFRGLQRQAFKQWLAYGQSGIKNADALKALAAQEGDLGGFLVVPQELVQRLVVTVKDLLYIRQRATVYALDKAESLGVPVLDTDLTDPTWTSELSTGSADATTPFGKRQLSPHPLAKSILISNKLLRQASIDPEAIVMDRLAYRFARTQENAFQNGTGQDQPLGLFVATSNGIDSTRDTTTAASATIAADDVIGTRGTLKMQYRAKAVWLMHRNIVTAVRKLKDSQGQYLWQPGLGTYVAQGTALIGAMPDRLLGHDILESELSPSSATTSGNYAMLLGDLSFYWIADALNMQIQRLIELYAATNQTGFIGRVETDGMPVLAEAFVRLKIQ